MSKRHLIPFVHLFNEIAFEIEDANLLKVHMTVLFVQNLQSFDLSCWLFTTFPYSSLSQDL